MLAPPSCATYVCKFPGGVSAHDSKRKKEIKFVFPAPFGPISTEMGPGSKLFNSRIVLKPRSVSRARRGLFCACVVGVEVTRRYATPVFWLTVLVDSTAIPTSCGTACRGSFDLIRPLPG